MDLLERRGTIIRRHPWETARALAIETIVRGLSSHQPRVLDIGCGDGYLVRTLHEHLRFRHVVAQDIHLHDALISELQCPGIEFVQELNGLAYQADLVLMLDVLEHVESPVPLLRQVAAERLADGGHLLITVPAFQWLFSQHDRYLRHVRRYSARQLNDEVESAGLAVQDTGFLFSSLLLPRALTALLERLTRGGTEKVRGAGDWTGGKRLTFALQRLLVLDNRFCLAAHRLGLTVPGLTIWMTCKKR